MGHEPEDTGRDAVVTAKFALSSSLALVVPVPSCFIVVTGAPVEMATPHPAQMQKTDDLSFSHWEGSRVGFFVSLHCLI